MLQLALAAALLASTPTTPGLGSLTLGPAAAEPVRAGLAQEGPEALFPPAQGALEIVVAEDMTGTSYMDLVIEYGELTDQNVTYSEDTATLLRQMRVHAGRSMAVPADEVQETFEHLLVQSNFCLQILKAEGVRVLEVVSLATAARNNIRASAQYVDPDDLDMIARHPAVIFTTVVSLPNLDVRQVSNSMRTMITDANTQQLLPAGNSNSMVIVGFGDGVAKLAKTLRLIDTAAGESGKANRLQYEVLALKKADAKELAQLLSQAMRLDAEGSRTQILADARTNSIIVTGPAADLADARKLVEALDS